MLVDSHCHLDFPQFAEDFPAVIERAREADVRVMQTISTRLSTFDSIHAIAKDHEGVFCSVGVHPHNAGEDILDSPEPLLKHADAPDVIGIGEAGLDYFYDKSPRDLQAQGFRAHIRAAQESGLPLIVHTRDADEDTLAIMEEGLAQAPYRAVIHCYSSSEWLGLRAIELGFYIGIGGILTFKNSTALRDTMKRMPRDRLILETDAPYLAPVPRRGKTNEPSYIPHIARMVAQELELGMDEVAKLTTDNFFRLFDKAVRPDGASL